MKNPIYVHNSRNNDSYKGLLCSLVSETEGQIVVENIHRLGRRLDNDGYFDCLPGTISYDKAQFNVIVKGELDILRYFEPRSPLRHYIPLVAKNSCKDPNKP